MEVGTYSKEPVKTQFGYHIILLEESSMTEPPAKEAVEGELRDQLSQEAAEAVITELREGAEIEILFGQQQEEATPEGGGEADSAPENDPAPENN
jgi:peptidyl-prolyl cis-trans isomerase C